MDLAQKPVFITGAASGIGLAFARAAAARGATLLLADVSAERLASAAGELRDGGAEVFAYTLDVADLEAYRALAASILAEHGAPFALFNNAGVAWKGLAASATPDDWRWMVNVNVLGLGYGISLFVPAMVAAGRGGYVVNTASITGLITSPGTSAVYGMTKHAVVAISEALTHELRPHGIHVTVVCPGSVATDIALADRALPPGIKAESLTVAEPAEREFTKAFVAQGLPADEIARRTFAAMAEGRTYVVTHPEYKAEIELRHRMIEAAVSGEPETDVQLLAMAKMAMNLQPLT